MAEAKVGVTNPTGATDAGQPRRFDSSTLRPNTPELPGPWSNPLDEFNSFSTIFTIGVLNPIELNYPKATYRKTGPEVVVLRSGGGLGDKKPTTSFETGGRIEYYIDDVKIESIVSPNNLTGITNATTMSFTVTEPYSMGLFLQTLQLSAKKAGYENYLEAPYILTIEFVGWDDESNRVMPDYNKRMIPMRFTNATFEVNEGGTIYACEAIAYNDIALYNQTQEIKKDVNITGETVIQTLQSNKGNEKNYGSRALTQILNDNESCDSGALETADSYVIAFPDQVSSLDLDLSNASVNAATDRSSSTPNIRDAFAAAGDGETVNSFLSGLSDDQRRLFFVEKIDQTLSFLANEDVSVIGNSKLVKDPDEAGPTPYGLPGVPWDDENNLMKRYAETLTVSGTKRSYKFKKGTKIVDIITEMVLISDYGQALLQKINSVDEKGTVEWFRIEPSVYIIPDKRRINSRGAYPKVYVYKVVKYFININFQKSPTSKTPVVSLEEDDTSRYAKHYNYIYTGQNNSIISFRIDYNFSFFAPVLSTSGRPNALDSQSLTNQTTTKIKAGNSQTADPHPLEGAVPTEGGSKIEKTTGTSGGSNVDSVELRVARSFHEALVNSNADLLVLDMEIMGDPYFLSDSGVGNYRAENSKYDNINLDGNMNYQNGEVTVRIDFRTPIDYGDEIMEFPNQGNTMALGAFSGIYRVTQITHNFSGNMFTQNLQLVRWRNQGPTANLKEAGAVKQAAPGDKKCYAGGFDTTITATTGSF